MHPVAAIYAPPVVAVCVALWPCPVGRLSVALWGYPLAAMSCPVVALPCPVSPRNALPHVSPPVALSGYAIAHKKTPAGLRAGDRWACSRDLGWCRSM